MVEKYTILVYEYEYDDTEVILVTKDLERAINTALSTEREPYFQIWENEKLKFSYGMKNDQDGNSKEEILQALRDQQIIE